MTAICYCGHMTILSLIRIYKGYTETFVHPLYLPLYLVKLKPGIKNYVYSYMWNKQLDCYRSLTC